MRSFFNHARSREGPFGGGERVDEKEATMTLINRSLEFDLEARHDGRGKYK